MKLFTLIAIAFLVFCLTGFAQDHVTQQVYPVPYDTTISDVHYGIYWTTPGLELTQYADVNSNVNILMATGNNFVYLFPFPADSVQIWGVGGPNNIVTCGHLTSRFLGSIHNLYQYVWNDRGGMCGCTHYRTSYIRVITNRHVNTFFDLGQSCNFDFREDTTFQTEGHSWYYRVCQMDAIRGDVDGDGQVTWADVDSMDQWILEQRLWDNLYRRTAPNPAWGRSFGTMPVAIHSFLNALYLQHPQHPWVVGLHINEPMSVQQSTMSMNSIDPSDINFNGNHLTVHSSDGQALIITFRGHENGQLMASSAWFSGGSATVDLPPWPVDSSAISAEAWTWMSPDDYENEREHLVTSDYSLGQNYPNPFNPTTTLPFDLKRSAPVALKVYNLDGQRVATVLNGTAFEAGHHQVSFSGAGLASGMYIYTITAGNYTAAKKMVLMK